MASSKDFGELVYVLGDMCIPDRVDKIPAEIENLIKEANNKPKYVLCTGNLSSITPLRWLQSISAPIMHIVRGDLDDDKQQNPFEKKIRIGNFDIGLIHGHQIVPWGDAESLGALQRKMGVDVLISGHTHQAEVLEYENRLLLNPGSITGAFNAITTKATPSFIVLSIEKSVMDIYLYELVGSKITVSKRKFEKKS
mmetsp:Transcript_31108/g.54650  ORF Transcript_31108/g.54650 Transcript_31108/m.54650 type:complete len:196 (+) Transcript_31108:34-621(+)|eukprot:CAMPEP_0197523466 /NCGR_PEP_ID=MMETSP1318-20131121/8390_1 /TAXON_ID=552666 /ORGANISM="Partenskyella glossopodia, Strain RCC365" /LENGTH=195 /DNA_ID=CAMNT_0043076167 /DNA_START=1 /DNA_END=588 /DNA_ORIENTATION=-